MSKQLILVRHAKSSWSDASLSDDARPLNRRGQRDAPRMGKRIAGRSVRPVKIISSDAARARETAEIIAQELGYDSNSIVIEPKLYLASPRQILDVLAGDYDEYDTVMLVAHNPGITELANQIADVRIDNMPTCAVLCVTAEIENWRDLGTNPGSALWFDYPKKIPA